jgi:hypothetical protein
MLKMNKVLKMYEMMKRSIKEGKWQERIYHRDENELQNQYKNPDEIKEKIIEEYNREMDVKIDIDFIREMYGKQTEVFKQIWQKIWNISIKTIVKELNEEDYKEIGKKGEELGKEMIQKMCEISLKKIRLKKVEEDWNKMLNKKDLPNYSESYEKRKECIVKLVERLERIESEIKPREDGYTVVKNKKERLLGTVEERCLEELYEWLDEYEKDEKVVWEERYKNYVFNYLYVQFEEYSRMERKQIEMIRYCSTLESMILWNRQEEYDKWMLNEYKEFIKKLYCIQLREKSTKVKPLTKYLVPSKKMGTSSSLMKHEEEIEEEEEVQTYYPIEYKQIEDISYQKKIEESILFYVDRLDDVYVLRYIHYLLKNYKILYGKMYRQKWNSYNINHLNQLRKVLKIVNKEVEMEGVNVMHPMFEERYIHNILEKFLLEQIKEIHRMSKIEKIERVQKCLVSETLYQNIKETLCTEIDVEYHIKKYVSTVKTREMSEEILDEFKRRYMSEKDNERKEFDRELFILKIFQNIQENENVIQSISMFDIKEREMKRIEELDDISQLEKEKKMLSKILSELQSENCDLTKIPEIGCIKQQSKQKFTTSKTSS